MCVVAVPAFGLTFNFTPAQGTSAQAIAGFQAAGARWSAAFNDNITINVDISFKSLGSGILGSTSNTRSTYSYTNVKNALTADALSADDLTAVGSLDSGSSYAFLINGTTTNSAVHTASATQMGMSNANAKALGLLAANNSASDGSIAFSSDYSMDFDPSNGISSNSIDFVGIATHEIGHLMGFTSGVDILDGNYGGFADSAFDPYHTTLDLFRWNSSGRSFVADSSAKNFSINRGLTMGALFSNGVSHGDGSQASHWKDNLGLGIMDPTAAPGELMSISQNDLRGMDVIGYNAVPEPTTIAALGLGVAALLRRRRK